MAIIGVIKGGRPPAPQPSIDGSMTDLLDYEIFTRVIKAGSLSAAARELHSTPAMISKRLTRLEDRLGVKLLHRTTRRLTPTEVGQSFYERVLAVLAAVADAESLAAIDNDRPRGLLRVSLPTSFGRLHVAPKLKAFLDTFPDLRLLVDLNDEYVDLNAGTFDVAVRIGTLPDSTLIARRLAPNRRVLCASPQYLEKYGTPRELAGAGPASPARRRAADGLAIRRPERSADLQASKQPADQLERARARSGAHRSRHRLPLNVGRGERAQDGHAEARAAAAARCVRREHLCGLRRPPTRATEGARVRRLLRHGLRPRPAVLGP